MYRWCNSDERAMLRHQANGYEAVLSDKPEITVPGAVPVPAGGMTRKRGPDLVLCRISRRAFEENIEARRKALRDQHEANIDDSIDAINADVESAMKARGQTVRGLVFKSSADANLDGVTRR